MRKILRRIGLYFLRWSGEDIPDIVIRNRFIPVLIEYDFFCPENTTSKSVANLLHEGEIRLLDKARPYLHTEHTRTEDGYKVRLRMIIQRYERKN